MFNFTNDNREKIKLLKTLGYVKHTDSEKGEVIFVNSEDYPVLNVNSVKNMTSRELLLYILDTLKKEQAERDKIIDVLGLRIKELEDNIKVLKDDRELTFEKIDAIRSRMRSISKEVDEYLAEDDKRKAESLHKLVHTPIELYNHKIERK